MTHSDSESFLRNLTAEEQRKLTTSELIQRQLLDEVHTNWNLSEEAKALCDTYFLLHWSGGHFAAVVSKCRHSIEKDGISYTIHYLPNIHFSEYFHAKRVGLSFRKLTGKRTGIVIPKIMYGMRAP